MNKFIGPTDDSEVKYMKEHLLKLHRVLHQAVYSPDYDFKLSTSSMIILNDVHFSCPTAWTQDEDEGSDTSDLDSSDDQDD
jgi:hypothetical protein